MQRVLKSVITLCVAPLISLTAVQESLADEPLRDTCTGQKYLDAHNTGKVEYVWIADRLVTYHSADPIVRIVGRLGDLIEVIDRETGLPLYRAYSESRDQMGGADGEISCLQDVRYFKRLGDVIYIRMGHNDDLLQAYGIIRDDNRKVVSLVQLLWNPMDSELSITEDIAGNQLVLKIINGHNRDLKYTICWDTVSHVWLSGETGRAGKFLPCTVEMAGQRSVELER